MGILAASARHIAVLTGTLLGGYAVFNTLFRLGASRMLEEGFESGISLAIVYRNYLEPLCATAKGLVFSIHHHERSNSMVLILEPMNLPLRMR